MPKITPAQRAALEAAHAFGDPNRYADATNPAGSMSHPYRASRFAMFRRLAERGLLRYTPYTPAYGAGYRITEAGLAALWGAP